MIVLYNDDLTLQQFLESSVTLKRIGIDDVPETDGHLVLGEIKDPAVALDLNELSRLPNGRLIGALFGHNQVPTTTHYDGTSNAWFALPNTWPPSIDTLVHLVGQKRSGALSRAESISEVACGTGMAGFYAFNKNPQIKRVFFSDLQEEAVQSALENCQFARDEALGLGFSRADGLPTDEKYDVIIASAIPATPGYAGLQRPLNPLFEGTSLLENIVRNARNRLNKGGRLIASHSSNGDKAFEKALEGSGATNVQTLYERDNAFRVEFLKDENWIRFLVEQGGLKAEPIKDHPYRHTVRVKEIAYD